MNTRFANERHRPTIAAPLLGRYVLDLASQTLQQAPPRVWTMDRETVGSRAWVLACLTLGARLTRIRTGPLGQGRRADVRRVLAEVSTLAGAEGLWSESAPRDRADARDGLLRIKNAQGCSGTPGAPPQSLIEMVQAKGLPYSAAEMRRVRRRQGR